jgi:hypothetical protein
LRRSPQQAPNDLVEQGDRKQCPRLARLSTDDVDQRVPPPLVRHARDLVA